MPKYREITIKLVSSIAELFIFSTLHVAAHPLALLPEPAPNCPGLAYIGVCATCNANNLKVSQVSNISICHLLPSMSTAPGQAIWSSPHCPGQ